MNEPDLAKLLQLRLAVGFLGERDQFAWWPTSFFAAASKPFLDPVFVKSALQAQYHGVVEAARRVHDERLSVGSFHLFRLPEEMEQDLFAAVKQEGSGANQVGPTDQDEALEALRSIAGATNGSTPEGPVLVGSIADIRKPEALAAVAGAYEKAFVAGTKAFPYFVSER